MKTKSSRPLNVLYISPNAQFGGAEKVCELMLKYHNRARVNPCVLFLNDGPLVEIYKKNGQVFQVPPARLRELSKQRTRIELIKKIISENNIDLVHSTMGYGHLIGGTAALKANVPNVWFQHGPVGVFDYLAGAIPTGAIVTNSEYTKRQQRKHQLFQKPSIHVVGSAIEHTIETLDQKQQLRDDFFTRNRLDSNCFLVGMVARLQAWKGVAQFLESANSAIAADSTLRYLLIGSSDIGDPTYRMLLKEIMNRSQFRDHFIHLERVEDMTSAYAAMDVCVHASQIAEPLGLVIFEAMAQGTPVIVSRRGGGFEDYVRDRESGFFSEPTAAALSKAILTLRGDPRLREGMSVAGLSIVRNQLTARHLANRLEDIYEKLCFPTIDFATRSKSAT